MSYDVDNDSCIDSATGILRNKLGIKTQVELDVAEAQIAAVQITTLLDEENIPPCDEFNPWLFYKVHKQIFESLYDWSGELRTVEISKGTTSFARAAHLESSIQDIFKELKADDYLVALGSNEIVEKMAYYYSELNVLHPFRDGNGRAIRTFLAMLAGSLGWHIAWDEMTPDENTQACIAAYQGDNQLLIDLFTKIVSPIDVSWGRDPYEFI